MDKVEVDEAREPVPDWAKPAGTATPSGHTEAKITPKQRTFLLSLIEQKEVEHGPKMAALLKALRISEDPEEFGLSKKKASELITWFLELKDKPKETVVREGVETNSDLFALPPGRYALPKAGTTLEDNELRFYHCWESRDHSAKRLYVLFGPSGAKLPYNAQMNIAKMIIDAGIRECAIRYGMEIGSCSNCGRRLTNRISRELGIGPICGGRMFGDSPEQTWAEMVKEAREAIEARGEDPNEELADDA